MINLFDKKIEKTQLNTLINWHLKKVGIFNIDEKLDIETFKIMCTNLRYLKRYAKNSS